MGESCTISLIEVTRKRSAYRTSNVLSADRTKEWDNCQVRVFTFDTSDPNAADPGMIELETDAGAISIEDTATAAGSALRVDQLPGATGLIDGE